MTISIEKMAKINENAKKWVKALRSGKYKQGKNHLRNLEDEFCCLGVACDLYQKEVGDLTVKQERYHTTYDKHGSYLPRKVQNWLNLKTHHGSFFHDRGGESLQFMNDNGASFIEIANIIEQSPEGLFK